MMMASESAVACSSAVNAGSGSRTSLTKNAQSLRAKRSAVLYRKPALRVASAMAGVYAVLALVMTVAMALAGGE